MDLNELMQDEEFMSAVEQAGSPNEIAQLLQAKGIEISAEELEKACNTGSEEMSENELENVSGGMIFPRWKWIEHALREWARRNGSIGGPFGGGNFKGGGSR